MSVTFLLDDYKARQLASLQLKPTTAVMKFSKTSAAIPNSSVATTFNMGQFPNVGNSMVATNISDPELWQFIGPPSKDNYSQTHGIGLMTAFDVQSGKSNQYIASTMSASAASRPSWAKTILPYLETDDINFTVQNQAIQSTVMDLTPEFAPPRKAIFKFESRSYEAARFSYGGDIGIEFYKTPEGKRCAQLLLQSAIEAQDNTLTVHAATALKRDDVYFQLLRVGRRDNVIPQESWQTGKALFACLRKDSKGLDTIWQAARKTMALENIVPNAMIVPYGAISEQAIKDRSDSFDRAANKKKENVIGTTLTENSVVIHEARPLNVDGVSVDLFGDIAQVGTFARLTWHLPETNDMLDNYTTGQRSILIINSDSQNGELHEITMRDMRENCSRFGTGGALSVRHDDILVGEWKNSLFASKGLHVQDMFIDGESGIVAKVFGQMPDWGLPDNAVHAAGYTMIKNLIRNTSFSEATAAINDYISLYKQLGSPDLYREEYARALIVAIQANNINASEVLNIDDSGVPTLPFFERVENKPSHFTMNYNDAKGDVKPILQLDLRIYGATGAKDFIYTTHDKESIHALACLALGLGDRPNPIDDVDEALKSETSGLKIATFVRPQKGFIPYYYGFANGLHAISKLPQPHEYDMGIVAKATRIIQCFDHMIEGLREFADVHHVALNTDFVPDVFKTNDNNSNLRTIFTEFIVGPSTHINFDIISPSIGTDTDQLGTPSFNSIALIQSRLLINPRVVVDYLYMLNNARTISETVSVVPLHIFPSNVTEIDVSRFTLEVLISAFDKIMNDQKTDSIYKFDVNINHDAGLMITSQLEKRYRQIKQSNNHLHRIGKLLTILSPITDNQFKLWENADIMIPVDFIAARPHQTLHGQHAVVARGGEALGRTVAGNFDARLGGNVQSKILSMHVSATMTAFVSNPRMKMLARNVNIDDYFYGDGILFWSPDEWYRLKGAIPSPDNMTKLRTAVPSIFSFMVPYGSTKPGQLPSYFGEKYTPGIRGQSIPLSGGLENPVFKASPEDPVFEGLPQYGSATYYNSVFGFSELNSAAYARLAADGSMNSFTGMYNTWMDQGMQLLWDPKKLAYKIKIIGSDVWGANGSYPGCKPARLGKIGAGVLTPPTDFTTDMTIIG